MRLGPIVVAIALCAFFAPSIARADDATAPPANTKTARLVYTRGDLATCPDEEQMKNAVSARLGYDPFRTEADQIVTASITKDATGLHGQVDLRDRTLAVKGSRTLTSKSDCEELAASMSLAISIAIDPLSITRPTPPPPAPVSDPPPAPAPDSSRDHVTPPPSKPSPQPEPLVLRIGASGAASFGATPSPSFSPAIFAGISFGALSLDLEGGATLATSADASASRGGDVSASLLLATLAPCFHLRIAMGCGLIGLGRLAGTGAGVNMPESASSLYADAGLRVGVEIPIAGPFAARAYGDVLFPLVTTHLTLRGADVWTTPPVSGAIGAGLLAHFP